MEFNDVPDEGFFRFTNIAILVENRLWYLEMLPKLQWW